MARGKRHVLVLARAPAWRDLRRTINVVVAGTIRVMTASLPSEPVRLGQVLEDFRPSAPPEAFPRIRRFVTFVGATSALESVQAFKIEEFLKLQVSTSTPPRLYMEALKAYFAFAQKAGHITADPMKNVRLPRATGIAATAARRTAAASVNSSATPVTPVASRAVEVEYVTRGRQQEMVAELDRLKVDERQRISALLEEAIKDGDLSENAGYDDAKMRQGLLEARIRELEDKLRRAALIEDQDVDVATVGVGSRVTLRDLQDDEDVEYTLVGPEETDPARFRISHRSPVGKALLGKRQGEEADVSTPSGTHRYRIVSVERDS